MATTFYRSSVSALCFLFAGICAFGPCAQASGLLHADGAYFRDAQGRAVLLRGVNVSNSGKVPPFDPMPDLSLLQKMRDWGINNIRLAFIWEAFEPTEGQYDFAYLDRLGQIVDAAGDQGISTVIDFHSDGFSRYSIGGCGSGFPKWTLPPDVRPHNPSNGAACSLWTVKAGFEDLFASSGFSKSENAFFSNTYGVRDRFLLAWTEIAHYFKNNPNVIGYDILNEPWGNETKQLAPLYEDVARTIRSEDPQAILMLEPNTLAGLGRPSSLPQPSFDNFAYAPHDYDPFALGLRIWFTGGLFVDQTLKKIESTSARLKAPVYLGEYGVSSDGLGMSGLIKHYYTSMDSKFVSSAQWDISAWTSKTKDGWDYEDMSIVDANENLRKNFVVRPYPIAVAGTPGKIQENFPKNSKEKKLTFTWDNETGLGNTVFFIPRNTLGGRLFTVEFNSDDSALACLFDPTTFMFSCSSPTNGNKTVNISIH